MDSNSMEHRRDRRRRHSAEFKMEVVNACGQPGASVAGVALSFSLNANMVRQWLRGRGFKRASGAVAAPSPTQRFIPMALPAVTAKPETVASDIRIEVRRGALHVNVSWPQSAAVQCTAWLAELLR